VAARGHIRGPPRQYSHTAFLINRIRLSYSKMVPSIDRRAKCKICGAEVEIPQLDAHILTLHPDYSAWGHRWRRFSWLLLGSGAVLVVSDFVYLRSQNQNFQYIIQAYLMSTIFLIVGQLLRGQRLFRDAWKKSHPSPSQT
jgi:hypothetical protein